MFSNKNFIIITILSVFLSLTQCKNKEEKQQVQNETATNENEVTLSDAQLKTTPIVTTELTEHQISRILKLNGKIDVPPQNLVSVSIPLGGYLKSSELLPGMKVSKGEVIAIIENPQFVQLQQDYLQAKSKLHFAELDYERQKTLNQSQASSDKVMQQAQAEMNIQRIAMNALAQQLQLINVNPATLTVSSIKKSLPVYSTVNGFVSKVHVNIGKYVNPSEVLFELVNPDDIHLNLKVYEKDVQFLKPNQPFVAYTNMNPEKKYYGEIFIVSKDVTSNGIVEVHCHFNQYDHDLVPGMYMNAEVEISSMMSNTLPDESIIQFEGSNFVFVETKKQTYELTPIVVGDSENEFTQVLNMKDFEGKKIVAKNAYILLMKLKNTSEEE